MSTAEAARKVRQAAELGRMSARDARATVTNACPFRHGAASAERDAWTAAFEDERAAIACALGIAVRRPGSAVAAADRVRWCVGQDREADRGGRWVPTTRVWIRPDSRKVRWLRPIFRWEWR